MTNEQAVVPSEPGPGASPQESVNEQDLNSLLREFEEEPKKSSEPPPEKTEKKDDKDDVEDLKSFVRDLREKQIREETEKGLKGVIENIRGDLKKVPEDIVRGLLEVRAVQNPALANAYVNRHKNPEAWGKIEKSLSRELKGMIDGLSDRSEESKKKVMEAVRTVQTQPQTGVPDVTKMNNREFEDYKRKIFTGQG